MVQRLLFFVLTILVVKRISSLPLRLLVAAPFVLLDPTHVIWTQA